MTIRGSRLAGSPEETKPAPTVRGSQFVSRPSRASDSVVEVKGGYISKSDYAAMTPDDQRAVKRLGVERFNKQKQDESMAVWSAAHVQVKDGWMAKADFDNLDADDQSLIKQIGVEAFNTQKKTEYETFKSEHVQIKDGWMAKDDFNKLSANDQSRITDIGVEAFNTEKQTQFKAVEDKLKPYYVAPEGNMWWKEARYGDPKAPLLSPEENFRLMWGLTYGTNLLSSGKTIAQVKALQDAATEEQRNKEQAGYNIAQAVAEGKVTEDELRAVGYDTSNLSKQIAEYNEAVATEAEAQRTINALEPYFVPTSESVQVVELDPYQQRLFGKETMEIKTTQPEGYNIHQAVIDGKVSIAQLQTAGFLPREGAPNADQVKAEFANEVEAYKAQVAEPKEAEKESGEVLESLKDYYVPATDKSYRTEVIGGVERKIFVPPQPEGYNTTQAYIDNKVSIAQLQKAGFIAKTPEAEQQFKQSIDTYKSTQRVMETIDKPEFIAGKDEQGNTVYNLDAIMAARLAGTLDINAGNLVQAGFDKDAVKQSIEAAKTAKLKQQKQTHRGVWQRGGIASRVAKQYLDFTIPGYATQRHWNEMGAPMKGVSIAIDVLSIVPILGAAGRGARAIAVTGQTTRLSRVGGALKGTWTAKQFAKGVSPERFTKQEVAGLLGKKAVGSLTAEELSKISASQLTKSQLKQLTRSQISQLATRRLVLPGGMVGETIHQIAWPAHIVGTLERPASVSLRTLKHPIRVGKVTARSAKQMAAHPLQAANRRLAESALLGTFKSLTSGVETAVRPTKLPEVVMSNADGTVRLLLKDTTSTQEAKRIRNVLMKEAAEKGQNPIILVGDTRYELEMTPLSRELGGGGVHATPSGDAFAAGLTVEAKPNMPLKEQGLFVGHQAYTRFTTKSAFGASGELPSVLVFSPEMMKDATITEKIYRGTVEMELKFPVGYKISPPKQHLFTRVGPFGERVEIFLWKPLSKSQVAKLKMEGLIEQAKTIYTPSLKISSSVPTGTQGLTPTKVNALADVIEEAGSSAEAEALRRLARQARSARSVVSALRALSIERARQSTRKYQVSVRGRVVDRGIETKTRITRVDGRPDKSRAVSTSTRVSPITRNASARAAASAVRNYVEASRVSPAGRVLATRLVPTTRRTSTPERTTVRGRPLVGRAMPTRRTVVAGRSPTRIRDTAKGRTHPFIPPPQPQDKRYQVRRYPEGSVGWRQGQLRRSVYWVMFRQGNKIVTKYHGQSAPEGARIVDGPRSAYESFGAAPGHRIPKFMKGELGIMDVESLAHGKQIRFKRVLARGKKGKPGIGKTR